MWDRVAAKEAGATATAPTVDELEAFSSKWALGDYTKGRLQAATPETQREAMNKFQPAASTKDVETKFLGFIRALALRAKQSQGWDALRAKAHVTPIGAAPAPVGDVPPSRLAAGASVGGSSAPSRRSPPPGVQASRHAGEVGGQDHHWDVHEAFGRSKLAEMSGHGWSAPWDSISHFVADWSLSRTSEELLRTLPPKQLSQVQREFLPERGSGNLDRKLASFVRKVGQDWAFDRGATGKGGYDVGWEYDGWDWKESDDWWYGWGGTDEGSWSWGWCDENVAPTPVSLAPIGAGSNWPLQVGKGRGGSRVGASIGARNGKQYPATDDWDEGDTTTRRI